MTKANSGRFVKGDPRINRNGRPKRGESLGEKFRDALEEKINGDYSKLDAIIDKLADMALEGNQAAIEYMLARGWGKMIDKIEITPKREFNLDKLSDEELSKLEELAMKAK